MSYTCDNLLEKLGKAEINLATTTGLYLGFAMRGTGFQSTAAQGATALSQVASLNECNFANYAMKNLTGLSWSVDTTAHQGKLTFSPLTYTALGSSTNQVVCAWIQWGSSTTTGRPLWVFDNAPLFPFSGGRDVVIASLTAGSVKLY